MESLKKTPENTLRSSMMLINNGVHKIFECTRHRENFGLSRQFRDIAGRSSSQDRSKLRNLETTLQAMVSQKGTNEKSSPNFSCDTRENPCTSTGIVEKESKISEQSMAEISRRKSLDSSQVSTPSEIQDDFCKCTHYELKKSKGKFKVNLFLATSQQKNSPKLEKKLFRSKSDFQLFPNVPEPPGIRGNNEYTIIKELSAVLPVLRANKNATEDTLLQNEKQLLISTEKVKLYTKNRKISKNEMKNLFLDVVIVKISKILIALKPESERVYRNAHFICLISTGNEIFPTKLVRLIPKKGTQCVEFDDLLELRMLDIDFKISVKVYCYQRKDAKLERRGLLKFLPEKTLAYPVQKVCCENLHTEKALEEVFLLPVFKQCAEFTISKANFSENYSCNSYSNSVFEEFGFIKKTLAKVSIQNP